MKKIFVAVLFVCVLLVGGTAEAAIEPWEFFEHWFVAASYSKEEIQPLKLPFDNEKGLDIDLKAGQSFVLTSGVAKINGKEVGPVDGGKIVFTIVAANKPTTVNVSGYYVEKFGDKKIVHANLLFYHGGMPPKEKLTQALAYLNQGKSVVVFNVFLDGKPFGEVLIGSRYDWLIDYEWTNWSARPETLPKLGTASANLLAQLRASLALTDSQGQKLSLPVVATVKEEVEGVDVSDDPFLAEALAPVEVPAMVPTTVTEIADPRWEVMAKNQSTSAWEIDRLQSIGTVTHTNFPWGTFGLTGSKPAKVPNGIAVYLLQNGQPQGRKTQRTETLEPGKPYLVCGLKDFELWKQSQNSGTPQLATAPQVAALAQATPVTVTSGAMVTTQPQPAPQGNRVVKAPIQVPPTAQPVPAPQPVVIPAPAQPVQPQVIQVPVQPVAPTQSAPTQNSGGKLRYADANTQKIIEGYFVARNEGKSYPNFMRTTDGDFNEFTKNATLGKNQTAFFTGSIRMINGVTIDSRAVVYVKGVSNISLTYIAGETSSEKLDGKYYRKQLERMAGDDTGVILVLIDGNSVYKFWCEDNLVQAMQ